MVAEGSGEESRLTEARANEAASIIQVNKVIKIILYYILYKIKL